MTVQAPKRALVLSGGGGRGAFQLGVLEHLEAIGWKPDIIVGTSIGSMNAAVYAVGGIRQLQSMWETIRTKDMHRFFRRRPWGSVFDRAPWKRTLEQYEAGRLRGYETRVAFSHTLHKRRGRDAHRPFIVDG